MPDTRTALIVGAGHGLSASLARRAREEGLTPLLAARDTDKLGALLEETAGHAKACNVTDPEQVDALFGWAMAAYGVPELVVYNPSKRVRGAVQDVDPIEVREAILTTCYGGFLVGRAAAGAMLPRGSGTILFTGASASVKGYPNSSAFAMGKFGLRGLVQSMARELAPKGIHVGHFVIDGGIGESEDPASPARLHPDAIAEQYFNMHRQSRSAWTWEMELRPFIETF